MEYEDSYPTCTETHADLCLYHDDLDPEEINRRLDLQYSWSCRKGDPISEKQPERSQRKTGAWVLSTKSILDSKDSRRHIDWLLDRIDNKQVVLEDLRDQGYTIRIICYWVSKHGHGGPMVSIEESERLARLGIELDFDLYFDHDREYREKFSLDQIKGFSKAAKSYLEPTVKLIKDSKFIAAEKNFSKTAIELINGVSTKKVDPKEADKIFTLLDTYISDNFEVPRPFRQLFSDLLFEGMLLHHYGDGSGFGPDLSQMKGMAEKLLKDR